MSVEVPRYSARVSWSDEDGCFIAVSPDFFGISAHGATRAEAMGELNQAFTVAIEVLESEGRPLPEPRLWPEYSGQFRLRLPKTLHAWLAAEAEHEGVSLNTYVVTRLAESRGARSAEQPAPVG